MWFHRTRTPFLLSLLEHVMSPPGGLSISKLLFHLPVVNLFCSCDAWLISFGASSVIDVRAHRQRNCYSNSWELLQSKGCRTRHRVQQEHDVHVWSALYGEGAGAGGRERERDEEMAGSKSSFEEWKEYFLRNNLGDPMTAPTSWEGGNSGNSRKISTPRSRAKVKLQYYSTVLLAICSVLYRALPPRPICAVTMNATPRSLNRNVYSKPQRAIFFNRQSVPGRSMRGHSNADDERHQPSLNCPTSPTNPNCPSSNKGPMYSGGSSAMRPSVLPMVWFSPRCRTLFAPWTSPEPIDSIGADNNGDGKDNSSIFILCTHLRGFPHIATTCKL